MAVEFIAAVYELEPGSVSATEIAVLAYLANCANPAGRCWPKRSTIARACGLHVDTVKGVLQALAGRGLIAKENRTDGDGRVISATVILKFQPSRIARPGAGAEPALGGDRQPPAKRGRRDPSIGGSSTPEQENRKGTEVSSLRSDTPRTRGRRIEEKWEPTEADREYAVVKGLTPCEIADLSEAFRDWHLSNPTAKALKADFAAAWRTWVRKRERERDGRPAGPNSGGRLHGDDRLRAFLRA